jgi:acetyl esterase/lipase
LLSEILAVKKVDYVVVVLLFGVVSCGEDGRQVKNAGIERPEGTIRQTVDGNKYWFYEDVAYLGTGRHEKMDIYIPFEKAKGSSKYPAVLNIHGGGWQEGHKGRKIVRMCAEAVVEKGYAVFCPDYLLNTDEKKAWPTNIYDCKTAVRYIRRVADLYNIDGERIGAMGNSAGGHLALLVGFSSDNEQLNAGGLYREQPGKVKCVVNIYGVSAVRDEWGDRFFVNEGEDRERVLNLASPVEHVSEESPPVLTIHGAKDKLVPLTMSQELDGALKAKKVEHEFVVVPDGRHAFTLYPDSVNGQTDLRGHVVRFLDEHLGTGRMAGIGASSHREILAMMGAKVLDAASDKEIMQYKNIFNRMDSDGDKKLLEDDYVSKSGHMTPEVRRRIFAASDRNGDGILTEAEYVENRIITDEAKAIYSNMDGDGDGNLAEAEFVEHTTIKDKNFAKDVFRRFDTNGNGLLLLPEYLKIWGNWAREKE